jgi:hypothetical protein
MSNTFPCSQNFLRKGLEDFFLVIPIAGIIDSKLRTMNYYGVFEQIKNKNSF